MAKITHVNEIRDFLFKQEGGACAGKFRVRLKDGREGSGFISGANLISGVCNFTNREGEDFTFVASEVEFVETE